MELSSVSLDSLPPSETDDLEYKSSRTPEASLKREIQNAASAFWNSGGGLFLAGINDKGEADGGIDRMIGRQRIEDWLVQVLSGVQPQGRYSIRLFEHPDAPEIVENKCVLAIEFAASAAIPHQSTDKRYYIRAGAHTVPAPNFIVDALYSRRHFRNPRLIHLARTHLFSTESDFLHIEVLAATEGVALDVEIDLDPRPAERGVNFPITVPLIDRDHSFGFRFLVQREPAFRSTVTVRYRDLADASYSYQAQVDASQCVPAWNRDPGVLGEICNELRELRQAVGRGGGPTWQ